MRISFRCKTNKDYVMINTATFALAGGGTVTIDRNETSYSISDGILDMEWRDCYLWRINDVNVNEQCALFDGDADGLLDGAELIELELEDDADEDYEVAVISWCAS